MQFLLLIYNDGTLLETMQDGEFDRAMKQCIVHADELRAEGKLLESQQLEAPATARTVRIRNGRTTVVDGPFAETKEMLGGFFLLDCATRAEAIAIARDCPAAEWATLEVREVAPCYQGVVD